MNTSEKSMKQNWVVRVFDISSQSPKSYYVNGYTREDVAHKFMNQNPDVFLLEIKKHEKLDKA